MKTYFRNLWWAILGRSCPKMHINFPAYPPGYVSVKECKIHVLRGTFHHGCDVLTPDKDQMEYLEKHCLWTLVGNLYTAGLVKFKEVRPGTREFTVKIIAPCEPQE
jgi:hypothetical protein